MFMKHGEFIHLKCGPYPRCVNHLQVTRSCSWKSPIYPSLPATLGIAPTCYSAPSIQSGSSLMFLLLLQYIGEDDLWKLSTLSPSKMIGRWVIGEDARHVTQLSITGFSSIAKPFMHSSILS